MKKKVQTGEKTYTFSLKKAFIKPKTKRTPKAVNLLRRLLKKHFRTEENKIKLSNELNQYLWQKGIQKPQRKIEIKAVKEEDTVMAYLKNEKIEKKQEKKEEEKTKEQEEKQEEQKKEEKEQEKKMEEKKEKEKAIEKTAIKKHTK